MLGGGITVKYCLNDVYMNLPNMPTKSLQKQNKPVI